MKPHKGDYKENCGMCAHLTAGVERHKLKPTCKKNEKKFKSRDRINYKEDSDLQGKCSQFIHYMKKKYNDN